MSDKWDLGNNFNNLFVIIRHGSTPNSSYDTVQQARDDGAVTFNYGHFIQTCLNFLFIAFALFWIVRGKNRRKWPTFSCPPPWIYYFSQMH
jgi:large conductance mechanosensitive channel